MTRALFVGMISGTSMDGIDAVLVDLDDPRNPQIIRYQSFPYDGALNDQLASVVAGDAMSAGALARLDTHLGEVFASAASSIIAGDGPVRAIGCHGQNVYHGPDDAWRATLQLANPHLIAHRTGCPVVADFRRRDLALGGQAAPLAPLLHNQLLRTADEDRAVLNLGGIANLTLLPADDMLPVQGFDTGPGNCLMDEWIGRLRRLPCDDNGQWAASGRISKSLLKDLRGDDYFQRPPPKSTGREYFNLSWVEQRSNDLELDAAAVQATLCELTASTVADALLQLAPQTARLLVCGGGVHNGHLMDRLAARLPDVVVESTASQSLPPDAVEALLFAELARRAVDGQVSDLESVTGAPAHCYGVVFSA